MTAVASAIASKQAGIGQLPPSRTRTTLAIGIASVQPSRSALLTSLSLDLVAKFMAVRGACMRRPLLGLLSRALGFGEGSAGAFIDGASVRAFAATTQPTGRTGSGSVTNVSGQREQEAAADEGAPPPDSSFDGGGAAGSAMGGEGQKEGAVNSEHTQNFDKEKGREGGKAAIGQKGTRQYSTFAAGALHASPRAAPVSHTTRVHSLRAFCSVETPTIDKEKATSDKDIFRSAPGGAAMEDEKEEEDPKETTSGEGEKVQGEGKPIGREMGTGSATNVSGAGTEGSGDVPADSSFDAGGSMNMDDGKHKGGREHTQNFDDEMKTKGGSKKAVN
ncbi:hypothetical protein KFL_001830010 [Klebsormidium nitens]|uniref:Uncharacterized protein n=1 Tax=Klebsormidium nitens TaxID=105231 RepID=A0A1Y1I1C8_KLENI|nr:hypothetical protein KFL_001830010 [Klebsormidium nitens]|eukprot:GAQ84273.1 hypothetical protein KFL_001830010 [Klebsormidium nitens]